MRYPWVVLFVWMSTLSLATTTLIPKRLRLHFDINGGQAKMKLDLKYLCDLASLGGQYEIQAREVVHNINLLTQVDNPFLLASLLKTASQNETLAWRNYNLDLSYWERMAAGEVQDKMTAVYTDIYRELTANHKLAKLLFPASNDVPRQIEVRMEEMINNWNKRIELQNLSAIYEIGDKERVFNPQSARGFASLLAKITAEIAQIDAARGEAIREQIAAMAQGSKHGTYFTEINFSKAAYHRAIIAEVLHNSGLRGQEEEARLQYLISDLWAVAREQLLASRY